MADENTRGGDDIGRRASGMVGSKDATAKPDKQSAHGEHTRPSDSGRAQSQPVATAPIDWFGLTIAVGLMIAGIYSVYMGATLFWDFISPSKEQ